MYAIHYLLSLFINGDTREFVQDLVLLQMPWCISWCI